MSHLLYFHSFSPGKFRNAFLPLTEKTLDVLFDPASDYSIVTDFDAQSQQKFRKYLVAHGLSYQEANEELTEMLDALFYYDLFKEESVIDLEVQPESDGGFHVSMVEKLLRHAGLLYHEGMGKLKDYPMLQFCLEGRRFGETAPMLQSDYYVVFDKKGNLMPFSSITHCLERYE